MNGGRNPIEMIRSLQSTIDSRLKYEKMLSTRLVQEIESIEQIIMEQKQIKPTHLTRSVQPLVQEQTKQPSKGNECPEDATQQNRIKDDKQVHKTNCRKVKAEIMSKGYASSAKSTQLPYRFRI